MNAVVEMLAKAVLDGRIKLEDIGLNFGLQEKTKKRLEEIKAESIKS